MEIQVLAFGIARDIVAGAQTSVAVADDCTIADLKQTLCRDYPEFEKLRSFTIAVNAEYRPDDFVLSAQDEVVIIPPVSGG